MEYEIRYLPPETWRGHVLSSTWTSDACWDVALRRDGDDFAVSFTRRPLAGTFRPDDSRDAYDVLYAQWWENAAAYGVTDADGRLLGVAEVCPEDWSNRLRVTELWVAPGMRRRGLGHALMDYVKAVAVRERRRAVLLETQSNNANAVAFYLAQGFTLIGFDACAYRSDDVAQREVRMEMGWFTGLDDGAMPPAGMPDVL